MTNPHLSIVFFSCIVTNRNEWKKENKKKVDSHHRAMQQCTQEKNNLALTIIYIKVVAENVKEKVDFLHVSLSLSFAASFCLSIFLLSIILSFFYLKAVEAITTNRNIGTGTAYNIIHTFIAHPLAIFPTNITSFLLSLSLFLFFLPASDLSWAAFAQHYTLYEHIRKRSSHVISSPSSSSSSCRKFLAGKLACYRNE